MIPASQRNSSRGAYAAVPGASDAQPAAWQRGSGGVGARTNAHARSRRSPLMKLLYYVVAPLTLFMLVYLLLLAPDAKDAAAAGKEKGYEKAAVKGEEKTGAIVDEDKGWWSTLDFLSKNIGGVQQGGVGQEKTQAANAGGSTASSADAAEEGKVNPAKAAAAKPFTQISRKVVAVADLHGDLDHAHSVLRMAGLISGPPAYSWVGGHSILVSTGDIVDRGDGTIGLYRLFDRLRGEARAAGGEVRNCLGNHEVMNALGDWRYVTRGDIESFGGAAKRREAISSDGWIGKTWLDHYNVSHTVDLLPRHLLPGTSHNAGRQARAGRVQRYVPPSASFVHGGITPYWAAQGLDAINALGQSFLRRALSDPNPTGHTSPSTPPLEQALYSETGPLWYRGYATDEDEATICGQASEALAKLSSTSASASHGPRAGESEVRHLVMGHTPHLDGFVVRCPQAQIMLIDTGISRAYGGEQSALIIETSLARVGSPKRKNKNNMKRATVQVDGDEEGENGAGFEDGVSKLYKEETTLTALYKGRKPKVITQQSRQVYIY